jgi:Sulfotransferase family
LSVLIHIGYHKTATSWLQGHLFKHPESPMRALGKNKVDAPSRQIVRIRPFEFDAPTARATFDPALQRIRKQGLLPVVSNERLSGHPSSGGYDSKEIADRLAAVFPKGKVLIVIREQQSVIRSVYKQYVLAGGPSTFEQFVRAPVDPADRMPGFDFRFYEYHHLIRHYQSRFQAGSVLVLPYEAFLRDPAAFVQTIGDFAGVPISDALLESLPFGSKLKRTPPATVIEVTRWSNRLARRSQYNPSPFVDSPWLTRHLRAFARQRVKRIVPPRIVERRDDALRRAVAESAGGRYCESNRITAELTGLDLGGYGWPV